MSSESSEASSTTPFERATAILLTPGFSLPEFKTWLKSQDPDIDIREALEGIVKAKGIKVTKEREKIKPTPSSGGFDYRGDMSDLYREAEASLIELRIEDLRSQISGLTNRLVELRRSL
jgi:hypothetical protein